MRQSGGGRAIGMVLAAAWAVVAAWLSFVMGGPGALAFAGLCAAGLEWWRSRRAGSSTLWPVAVGMVLGMVVWNGVSLARAAVPDNGDRFSSRVAEWGRDHGLSPVIDRLEAIVYSKPPSVVPAGALSLATTTTTTTTAPSTDTVAPGTPDTAAAPTVDSAATTTVATGIRPPAPLHPVFNPPLPGEGIWTTIATAGGADAMWATSVRPLKSFGGVVATMVVIDQTHVRTAMFNGSDQPGGTWARGNHVPSTLQPMLLAAMNGGFRFEHIAGGYATEGVVVKPLRSGDATLAIDRHGILSMGRLGRDIQDDGTWASLRQNLELIVDGGRSNVQQGIRDGVWWGADHGHQVYVKRSAVCTLADGRIAYVMADPVDAEQLAQSLIEMGCLMGMQMDINADWPAFLTYGHSADAITPRFVDTRMTGNPRRYLAGSTKEFFAFFDATAVPAGTVLDR